jgi:hypothetical protein
MEYFILNVVLILRYVEDNFAEKAKRDLQYLCWGQLRQCPYFVTCGILTLRMW